jgi:hypothetical protein
MSHTLGMRTRLGMRSTLLVIRQPGTGTRPGTRDAVPVPVPVECPLCAPCEPCAAGACPDPPACVDGGEGHSPTSPGSAPKCPACDACPVCAEEGETCPKHDPCESSR